MPAPTVFFTRPVLTRNLQYYVATAFALLLSACATPPAPRIADEVVRPYIETLFAEHLYFTSITNACSSLGGAVKASMVSAQNLWLEKNATLLRNANDYYADIMKNDIIEFQSSQIALDTIRFIRSESIKVEDTLSFMRFSNTNKKRRCERLKDDFLEASSTLTLPQTEPQVYRQIMAYSVNRTANEPSLELLPKLAGSFQLTTEKGRSAFNIEKLLKEVNCEPELLITLTNNWPEESYIGYCSNDDERLVHCTWGNCKVTH